MVALLVLGQSYDCPNTSEATMKGKGKLITLTMKHYNITNTQLNKTMSILYGIYIMSLYIMRQ